MQQHGYLDQENVRTQQEDVVYVDRDDTMNVLHAHHQMMGAAGNGNIGQQKQFSQIEL